MAQLKELFSGIEDDFEFDVTGLLQRAPREEGVLSKPRTVDVITPLFATSAPIEKLPELAPVVLRGVQHPVTRARRRAGLSQSELAKKAGVGLPTLKRFEQGLSNPKLSTISKLAAALNTSIDAISRR